MAQVKRLILFLALAVGLYAQTEVIGDVIGGGGGGGGGSGTVGPGTVNNLACFTASTTVDDCPFFFNGSLLVLPTGGAGGVVFGDQDSGLRESSDDILELFTSGGVRAGISGSVFEVHVPMRPADGSAAAPGWSFRLDTDLGFYRAGANQIGVAVAGETFARLGGSQTALVQDETPTTGSTLFVVKGGAGQSGNIFEVRDSADAVRFAVGDGAWDGFSLTPTAAASVTTPPSGDYAFFLNSDNSDAASLKDSSGTTTAIGGSGGDGGAVRQTFTDATSATITHNFGSLNYVVRCKDTSNQQIEFDSYSSFTSSAATVDFDGVSLSGDCVAVAGGTGGSSTINKEFVAGGCQNGAASSAFNYGTSEFPSVACDTGTNNVYAVLQFDNATDEAVIDRFRLEGSVPTINLDIVWRTAAASGSVVWGIQTACIADGETGDPSWNTAQTVTDTAKNTTLQWNDAEISSVTTTGCAGDENLAFRFFRDADNGSDTVASDAHLISLRFELVY